MIDFTPFPKIPRLNRDCVISEKIDGTNACIHITENGYLYAGSRSRFICPADDNYGFAAWAYERAPGLVADLGPGTHFGEWWGAGIQRSYGLKEKRFSLFNTSRWGGDNPTPRHCHVVPVLYSGPFLTSVASECLERLKVLGSVAAPGHMTPEGIIVYHIAANAYFKATIDKMNDFIPWIVGGKYLNRYGNVVEIDGFDREENAVWYHLHRGVRVVVGLDGRRFRGEDRESSLDIISHENGDPLK